MSEKIKLSTEPYKGVRDFYPEDMCIENYIFSTMKKVVESFGYEEYNASPLEPTDLYRAKSSEEIVKEQTYSFTDRGGRDVTLRPEMTPTVARMIAGKTRELVFPLRWYSIPNVFRYENPQRGRLREHYQLNVDLFGSESLEADIEMITVASKIMKGFGAKDSDFVIKINSRKLLEQEAASYKLSLEQTKELRMLKDKAAKMPPAELQKKLDELVGSEYKMNTTASPDITAALEVLHKNGVKNGVFAPEVIRGFDYYTGIVFEVFDTDPKNSRSLFGGGRYDDLVSIFGAEKIPAVGFGMGDVTIRDFLETHGLLPTYAPKTKIQICVIDEQGKNKASEIAQELRDMGVNTAIDVSGKKIGDQISKASKKKVPFVIVIGEKEVKENKFTVKNLGTSEEKVFDSIEKLSEYLKKPKE